MSELSTSVRFATDHDIPALARLLQSLEHPPPASTEAAARLAACGHTIVLSYIEGGLAAAAHVRVDGNRGILDLLLVDADAAREPLERRLIAVADAICTAHDCVLDRVPSANVPGSGCVGGGPSFVASR